MNRRQLLSLQQPDTDVLESSSIVEGPRTQSGLTPYAGPWTNAEVKHLLRRAMFGATKADVEYFLGLTMDQAVAELLTPTAAPSPPVYLYNDDLNVPYGTPWVDAPYNPNFNNLWQKSMRSWWYGQMLNQGRSIQEKMVFFWHNHFSTETVVVKDARFIYLHNTVLRQYALGNFKNFVKAITIDPAMLIYLNGNDNTVSAPDENYGRELQELFTIGKDENGIPYYTESDVQQAAKVLTGYRVNSLTISSFFNSSKHDPDPKSFSSFYNNTVIAGTGQNELDELLNMIFATQQAAVFICRKLYRYFIYYTIDAQVETDVIQPLATIFRNNNYEIKPVLDALFKSEHFYDVANRGALIKTPVDYTIGFCRDMQVAFPGSNVPEDQYASWQKIWSLVAAMGQVLGDPPNVAGWPAWYQEPQYHELWINTTTLPNRNIFSDNMNANGYKTGSVYIKADVVGYTKTVLTNPGDPDLLIQEVIDLHLSQDVSPAVKAFLKNYLLSGQTSNYYWTDAWDIYILNPGNNTYYTTVADRLKLMYKYLMDLPEYQLS